MGHDYNPHTVTMQEFALLIFDPLPSAALVPLDRLMLETDCPYISPEPMRKQKVNEPALMVHTAAKIAELKAMDLEPFSEAIAATTQKFFSIDY